VLAFLSWLAAIFVKLNFTSNVAADFGLPWPSFKGSRFCQLRKLRRHFVLGLESVQAFILRQV